jgi:predicted ATP-grasp superfamily ATP-dependent carboligase
MILKNNSSLKILITEANTKNSIALQRELYKYSNLYLIAFASENLIIAKQYRFCKKYYKGDLLSIVKICNPDLIIPVGGVSVSICSKYFRHLSLLPPEKSLEIALNKVNLNVLNNITGVNYPYSKLVTSLNDIIDLSKTHTIVIKSDNESIAKFDPIYIEKESDYNFQSIQYLLDSKNKLLVQEKVTGIGRGFFCIAREGKIYTFYMHERIREIPVTGGSSTAAKSIYCHQMDEISKNIVKYLNWTGPLMIEYKYDNVNDKYHLIELNPKFWGSLDLSYEIGLQFGKTLIDLFFSPEIVIKTQFYKIGVKYFWVLDGDLLNIIKQRNFLQIKEYFSRNSKTSLFQNFRVDLIKLIWTIRNLFK